MSVRKTYWVACDAPGCRNQEPTDMSAKTRLEARIRARYRGWCVTKLGDTCPACLRVLAEKAPTL
jgi:hypothetical protein